MDSSDERIKLAVSRRKARYEARKKKWDAYQEEVKEAMKPVSITVEDLVRAYQYDRETKELDWSADGVKKRLYPKRENLVENAPSFLSIVQRKITDALNNLYESEKEACGKDDPVPIRVRLPDKKDHAKEQIALVETMCQAVECLWETILRKMSSVANHAHRSEHYFPATVSAIMAAQKRKDALFNSLPPFKPWEVCNVDDKDVRMEDGQVGGEDGGGDGEQEASEGASAVRPRRRNRSEGTQQYRYNENDGRPFLEPASQKKRRLAPPDPVRMQSEYLERMQKAAEDAARHLIRKPTAEEEMQRRRDILQRLQHLDQKRARWTRSLALLNLGPTSESRLESLLAQAKNYKSKKPRASERDFLVGSWAETQEGVTLRDTLHRLNAWMVTEDMTDHDLLVLLRPTFRYERDDEELLLRARTHRLQWKHDTATILRKRIFDTDDEHRALENARAEMAPTYPDLVAQYPRISAECGAPSADAANKSAPNIVGAGLASIRPSLSVAKPRITLPVRTLRECDLRTACELLGDQYSALYLRGVDRHEIHVAEKQQQARIKAEQALRAAERYSKAEVYGSASASIPPALPPKKDKSVPNLPMKKEPH